MAFINFVLQPGRSVVLGLVLLVIPFALQAQEALTLQEVVAIGLENNYDIRIAEKNQLIPENDVTLGNAGFLPILDVQAIKNWSKLDVTQNFLDGRVNERSGASAENFNASAIVFWRLFDGLGMFRNLDRLIEERAAGEIQTKIAIANNMADIITAYYTVLLEQARLDVLDSTIRLSDRRMEIAQNKYEVGKASKVEYLAAQVDYNSDRTLRIQQEQFLANAKIELNRLLGRDLNTTFELVRNIQILETLSKENLLSSANLQNPDFLMAQTDLNIANLEIRQIRAEQYPTIDFNTSYLYNTSSSEAGFLASNQQNGYNYGFTARVNVFNGLNLQRRKQNAQIAYEVAELRLEELKLSLESDISKTYNVYTNNLNLIEIETENLDVARENEEIALERYRLGNTTPLELREAQVNAVQAQSRLLNAFYNTKVAEIELLRLSGNIIPQNLTNTNP